MSEEYMITFTDKKIDDYCFSSESSFIEWIFQNKNLLKDGKFIFKNEINIDIKRMENVCKFLKYYLRVKKTLDISMNSYNEKILKINSNEEIKKALAEFVRMNDSGKFLRATLIGLGYNTCDKDDNNYIDLALALEIFQTSILIHDDIIDNARVRRGKETIPVSYINSYKGTYSLEFASKRTKFADSMAICIADMGFYLAEELIVDGYKSNSNLASILSYYHNIAIKTCHGEMIDIVLPFKEKFFNTDPNLEDNIMEVYKLKTAWYSVVGPYCLGLTLGGADNDLVKKMESILLNVGIAFQIKDDLLGIYGDEALMGKSTNSDIEEFKQTILYSHAVKTLYKDELLKYYGKRDLTNEEVSLVKDIFEKAGSKKYAEDIMTKLFKDSLERISDLEINEEYKNILLGFIVYLQNRSK